MDESLFSGTGKNREREGMSKRVKETEWERKSECEISKGLKSLEHTLFDT